ALVAGLTAGVPSRSTDRAAPAVSRPEADAAENAGVVVDDGHVRRQGRAVEQPGVPAAHVELLVVEEGFHAGDGAAHALVPLLLARGGERRVADEVLVVLALLEGVVAELDLPWVAVGVEAAAEPRAEGDHGFEPPPLDDPEPVDDRIVDDAHRLAG